MSIYDYTGIKIEVFMIKKAFSKEKEVDMFKDFFRSGKVKTEQLSNLLQPYYGRENPSVKNYCDFWRNEESVDLLRLLKTLELYGEAKTLDDSFGKPNFIFEGNRQYEHYLVNYNDLLLIVGLGRSEIVVEEKIDYDSIVGFAKEYSNLIIKNLSQNYANLREFEQKSLNKLKNAGIISENNTINFDYKTIENKSSIKP